MSWSIPGFSADSCCGGASFVEDQAVEVIGQIGQSELCLDPLEADGADEQPEPVFLMRRHMLDPSPDRGLCGIGAGGGLGHGLSLGLATVDATGQHTIGQRSEEHTSELQSLMRISYAVFCLKKKNNTKYTRSSETRQHRSTH